MNKSNMQYPTFSKTEHAHYAKDKAHFDTPLREWIWGLGQVKCCSKCEEEKKWKEFSNNTSGADGFDKDGYRLKRPECSKCKKESDKGKNEAMKLAKELGIPFKAPEGAICKLCKKPPKKGDGLVFDHCHKTHSFRGYLHNSCNRSMGTLGDDMEGLIRAVNYLIRQPDRTYTIMKSRKDGTFMLKD